MTSTAIKTMDVTIWGEGSPEEFKAQLYSQLKKSGVVSTLKV